MDYKTANTATIKREIKGINDARIKLVDRIQAAALACIYHAHVNGEVSLAVGLAKACGNGVKHESLRLYLSEFGPMNPEKGDVLKFARSKRKEGEELDAVMAAAMGKKWYESDTEKKAEEFSFAAGLHSLLRKLDNAEGYEPTPEEAVAIKALRELADKVPVPVRKKKQATA